MKILNLGFFNLCCINNTVDASIPVSFSIKYLFFTVYETNMTWIQFSAANTI